MLLTNNPSTQGFMKCSSNGFKRRMINKLITYNISSFKKSRIVEKKYVMFLPCSPPIILPLEFQLFRNLIFVNKKETKLMPYLQSQFLCVILTYLMTTWRVPETLLDCSSKDISLPMLLICKGALDLLPQNFDASLMLKSPLREIKSL